MVLQLVLIIVFMLLLGRKRADIFLFSFCMWMRALRWLRVCVSCSFVRLFDCHCVSQCEFPFILLSWNWCNRYSHAINEDGKYFNVSIHIELFYQIVRNLSSYFHFFTVHTFFNAYDHFIHKNLILKFFDP